MNYKSENIIQDIMNRKDDLIDLTQALIRIPTLNPPGNNYLEICEFLKKRMEVKFSLIIKNFLIHINQFLVNYS